MALELLGKQGDADPCANSGLLPDANSWGLEDEIGARPKSRILPWIHNFTYSVEFPLPEASLDAQRATGPSNLILFSMIDNVLNRGARRTPRPTLPCQTMTRRLH